MVAKVVKASFPGHVLQMPEVWRAPYIFASPHSGRDYPTRFLDESILDLPALRRSEDAYVDLLMPKAAEVGIPCLSARFPRAFVDVNRNAREIDPYMFTASPVDGAEIRSNRVLAGFGVIPKYAAEGRSIYARKLPASEGRSRIKWCYEPYHAALRELIEQCLSTFGIAIVVDWHSMPSTTAGGGRQLPDVVLGDKYGSACDSSIIGAWEKSFSTHGLSVSRNAPYAGGHVTTLYGQPSSGVHALQVEINRALYLDEAKVARLRQRFDGTRDRIAATAKAILGDATAPSQLAAE